MSQKDSLVSDTNPIRPAWGAIIPPRHSSGFDRVAGCYPWLEARVFGRKLEQIRSQYLNCVTQRENVLIVGEGNGRFCAALVYQKVSGSVTIVDSSARMLAAVRSRIGDRGRNLEIRFIHADVREWQPDRVFDCLVTQFFFDLFKPSTQEAILGRLTAACTGGAGWLDTDFTADPTGVQTRILYELQYIFFKWSCGIEASSLSDVGACTSARLWQVQHQTFGSGRLVQACWRVRRGGGMDVVD
jgi:tRNA (cmo5U34)-methyltransferase